MSVDASELQRIALALTARLAAVSEELSRLSERVTTLIRDVSHRSSGVARSDLTQLSGYLRGALLDSDGAMDGIGIATATGYLQDSEHWLEWWRRGARGRVEFVVHSLNPEQDVFYDYESRRWFASPITERRTIITGPYVDMGGTNAYTLTVASPIVIAGEAIGVAGADISASRFERYLLSAENAPEHFPRRLLTNFDGRVIASTAPEYPPGTFVDERGLEVITVVAMEHDAPPNHPWRILELR